MKLPFLQEYSKFGAECHYDPFAAGLAKIRAEMASNMFVENHYLWPYGDQTSEFSGIAA